MADARIPSVLQEEARSIYGSNVEAYEAGRPDYPSAVYETLKSRCGLRAGSVVLEVGPGTGLVTGHLLKAGAQVVAVEPDERMAEHLLSRFPNVEIFVGTFEQAKLETGHFDLFVAATSFHWVDQAVGIPKLARILKPGGWASLWWTIFDDPNRPDPFRRELQIRTGEEDPGSQRKADFQLDLEARQHDLRALGHLNSVHGEVHHWDIQMNGTELRALYASMINIARRSDDEKQRFLDHVAGAVETLGPTVSRPFVTVLYTGQKSAEGGG